MMIAPNSLLRKGDKEKGKVEWNADYEDTVQHSQQHVAPCVKRVEWGLCTRGLRMVAAFWAGIAVEVTQEAG